MSLDPRLLTGRIVLDGNLAGTAWRAGPTTAITAAHCLRVDPIQRRYHASCTIFFNDDPTPATATVRVVGEKQCLDEKLDVAILDLDRSSQNFVPLATPLWPDAIDEKWVSYGYPDAKPDGMGLSGTITHVGERTGRGIQLLCDQGGAGNLKHSSGSPVIVRGRAVGLIVWNPEALLQKVIFARTLDVVALVFPSPKVPVHPGLPIVGHREEPLHLQCDRDPQWGSFYGCIRASSPISAFFVSGPDREAPEKFIARIEHADSEDYQLRTVRWRGSGYPPAAQRDYIAALSRSLFYDELSEEVLVDQLLELGWERKVVIQHPLINLTSEAIKLRLDDIFAYYYATLPALFHRRHPLPRDVRGFVFLQPFYWEPRGLGKLFGFLSDRQIWRDKMRASAASPIHAIMAPDFTRITVEHVENLLGTVRDLPEADRVSMLREVRRYRTSRDVLTFLERMIG